MANNNKHTGPNVPALRFPEFSGEWEKVLLSSACEINPKTGSLDNQFLYIDLESVVKGSLVKRQIIEKDGAPSRAQRVLKENDILYQCVRPYQLNNYIFEGDTIQCVASTGYAQLRTTQFPLYIFQALHTKQFTNQVLERCTGTNYPAINSSDLGTVEVPICSLPEQVKIGSLLALIDSRIKTQSKIIKELTALRSALTEKCSRQAGTLFSLADILEETDERSTVVNQYQVLSSTVKGIFSQKEYFNKDIASEDNKGYKVVRRGNVVLSPQNLWMGNINYNNRFDVGIVSPSYKIYSIKKGFNPTFIAALLKTKKALYEYMLASEQGASVVRRNLNVEAFMGITFRIPNAYQQEVLSKAIAAIDLKLSNELAIFEQLQLQKGSLLENMFI